MELLSGLDPNLVWVLGSVVLLGICTGAVGTVLALRKQGLLGDVLAHAALPGVALGFLIFESRSGIVLMGGALVSCSSAYILIQAFVKNSKIKADSAFAVVLSYFFAMGAGLITYVQKLPLGSQSGLDRLLFGQAGALVRSDLQALGVLAIIFMIFFALTGRKLKELTFDRQFCLVQGVNARIYDTVLAVLAVALIALSLQLVGAVMLAGLLIIPAASARLWIKDFRQMVFLSSVLGACAGVVGVIVSYRLPAQPTGPWIILWATLFFAISFIFAPGRGVMSTILKRRAFRDRVDQENILRSIYREVEKSGAQPTEYLVDYNLIMLHRTYSRPRLNALIQKLVKSGLIERSGAQLKLTNNGFVNAQNLTKGHRLWEALLASGQELDASLWHQEAEDVEHLLSIEQMEQLQEKLKRPGSDPHGRVIPGGKN